MHIYIKHPQACIHVYKHRHIGFPQRQNHWWMKHYFQQSFVSRLDVSQHWYTDTPTSSPLCFLPTRTTTMSIHNPPHTDTQTRTLVNRELICSYLPLSNSPFWQSEAVQQEAINLHLHLHTARTWRAQCCHIRHTFQKLNTLVVKDIYTNTRTFRKATFRKIYQCNVFLMLLTVKKIFWYTATHTKNVCKSLILTTLLELISCLLSCPLTRYQIKDSSIRAYVKKR